jgi:hypothetical protein
MGHGESSLTLPIIVKRKEVDNDKCPELTRTFVTCTLFHETATTLFQSTWRRSDFPGILDINEMVGQEDFVVVDIQSEALLRAIDYAGRSIHFTYDRMQYAGRLSSRLIRIVVGIAIEQAFETYLQKQGVAYGTGGRTHWRTLDTAEFTIDVRRIDIKGYHVYPGSGRIFPHWFLDVEALVPQDQIKRQTAPDAYLQAFLVSPQQNHSARRCYTAIFPRPWANRWREPRPVYLTAGKTQSQPVAITLYGEGPDVAGEDRYAHGDVQEEMWLPPAQTIRSHMAFCSLQQITCPAQPAPDLQVQIAANGAHIFQSADWSDLWLDKPQVTFAAWGSKEDYRSGEPLPRGTRTRLYTGGTRTPNFSRLIRELRPVATLIEGK